MTFPRGARVSLRGAPGIRGTVVLDPGREPEVMVLWDASIGWRQGSVDVDYVRREALESAEPA